MTKKKIYDHYEVEESYSPEEMMEHYHKLVVEQEEVKKRGYATDHECWLCKKFFKKLGYRICDNGYISYICYSCLKKE